MLKRLYGLNVDIDKVYDTLVMARLVFPPKSSKERYSLGSVAQRLGIDGRLVDDGETVLKKLAAQYGGFDAIPLDNEEYVEYAKQDVRATANVYQQLLTQNVVSDDYLRREHAKMQRIAVVEEKGVRIDLDALGEMVAEEEATKNDIRTWLVDTVGIPGIGKAPWSTTVGKQAISRNVQY